MSLEAALAANTEALTNLAAALKESNAGRAAAVEQLAGAATTAAPKKRSGRPAGATETPPADATPKAMTVDEFRAEAGKFMDTTDEEVRKERRVFVKAILDHFGVKAVIEIPADNFAKVCTWFVEKLAGKTVNFSDGEDEQQEVEEEEDDLMG